MKKTKRRPKKQATIHPHPEALPDVPVEEWERQTAESAEAFEAWVVYRDMDGRRSTRRVSEELSKSEGLIKRWALDWHWTERLRSWQRHVDELARQEQIAEIIKYRRRTARQMMAKAQTLMLPDMLLNEKLSKGAKIEELLKGISNKELVMMSIRAAQALPQIAKAEALALGDTTERTEQVSEPLDVLTERISANPAARAAAAKLIQELSQ